MIQNPEPLPTRAEILLRDGKYHEGRALLAETLDATPTHLKALDVLGSLAEVSQLYESELFTRLYAALAAARETGLLHRLRGRQLCYALFFGRRSVCVEVLASLEDYVLGDENRRAAAGALLVELGRSDEGERVLRAASGPLAKYHLALLAASRRQIACAREQLDRLCIPHGGELLGRIGIAFLELERKKTACAHALLAEETTDPHARSELRLLRVCLAIVEERRRDAEIAAYDLANPPYHADPSALSRAASLLGISSLSKLSQH